MHERFHMADRYPDQAKNGKSKKALLQLVAGAYVVIFWH